MPTPPVIRFSEFNPSGVSPSGSRHLTTHGSYVKQLGTSAGQSADFGSVNNTNTKKHTNTKAVVAMVDNLNDATEAIFNMRFWVADFSDWISGTFQFNGFPSGTWIQNIQLTDASGYFIPTSLPSGQNWWRDAGGQFNRNSASFQEITGSGDAQVTQYMYISVSVDTDVPIGTYGGNTGGWTMRMTYDYR